MTMTAHEYLQSVLKSQEVKPDGAEMKALQAARAEVEAVLRAGFTDSSPTIRYGGSKVKRTMNLDDYDLDIICYFPHDETAAGDTLAQIYNNARTCLQNAGYGVDSRTTALRVRDKEGNDFHIDVVPGRFTDESKTDAFLHQNGGSKKYLKTNPQVHVEHIAKSGCTDDIRFAKLWRPRYGVSLRTFPLELLVVKIMKGTNSTSLDTRLSKLFTALSENEKYSIRSCQPARQ
jgi:hypothetical protein